MQQLIHQLTHQGVGLVVGGGAVFEQRQAQRQAQLLRDVGADVAPGLQPAGTVRMLLPAVPVLFIVIECRHLTGVFGTACNGAQCNELYVDCSFCQGR